MCLGMANGVRQSDFINETITMGDLGKIFVPKKMLEKLGIEKGQKLNITSTNTLIIIEKCRNDGEDNE